jgi:hypothetical protein
MNTSSGVKMGDVVYFSNYKKKKRVKFNWAQALQNYNNSKKSESDSFVSPNPWLERWGKLSLEEKISELVENKFCIEQYIEYVSLCRFYKQFDNSIVIDNYSEWIRKAVTDENGDIPCSALMVIKVTPQHPTKPLKFNPG